MIYSVIAVCLTLIVLAYMQPTIKVEIKHIHKRELDPIPEVKEESKEKDPYSLDSIMASVQKTMKIMHGGDENGR